MEYEFVRFNLDGELNDLGLEDYCTMAKEEIINYLSKFCEPENVGLLRK